MFKMKSTFYLSYEELTDIAREHLSKNHNIPMEDVEVRYKVPRDIYKDAIINIETEEERTKVVTHMKNLMPNGGLMNAVKYIRAATGCGLWEAVNFVKKEELWKDFIINNSIPLKPDNLF